MLRLVLLFLVGISSLAVHAGESDKRFNIGLGTYALVVANDSTVFDDDRFSGISLSGQYAVSDMFALRAAYYAVEHDDISSLDNTGFDVVGYIGAGLKSDGFKIYGGGGIFSESWELAGGDKSFNGLQLSGGIGYNWQHVGLDLVVAIREKGDYEDLYAGTGVNVDAAASGSLILSARF